MIAAGTVVVTLVAPAVPPRLALPVEIASPPPPPMPCATMPIAPVPLVVIAALLLTATVLAVPPALPPSDALLVMTWLMPPPPATDCATRPWAKLPLVVMAPLAVETLTAPLVPADVPAAPSVMVPEKVLAGEAARLARPPPLETLWARMPIACALLVEIAPDPLTVTSPARSEPLSWPRRPLAVPLLVPMDWSVKLATPPPPPIDCASSATALTPVVERPAA
ncbi:hypothetical protein GCM10007973_30580 [Polymorphobacter multimanifer]|nr:hypothetical protein GCM10007973_30580 [Polymorphobacter multimanifer]